MRLTVTAAPLPSVQCDWLVLPCWEDTPSRSFAILDQALGGRLTKLREAKDLTGKNNELLPLYDPAGVSAARVLLLGLGKREAVTRHGLTRAGYTAAKLISQKRRLRVAVALPEFANGMSEPEIILALGPGLLQGCTGPGIRQSEPARFPPDEITLVVARTSDELEAVARRVEIEGRAVRFARELVNLPPGEKSPEAFAQRIQESAKAAGLVCTILDEGQIRQERMGCLLGVAQGSTHAPRLAVLEYRQGRGAATLGLIGKGVTFDSGGLSLKTTDNMLDMKCDMAGAAAVIGAAQAIAELKIPVNLLAVTPLVENMPGGTAVKLGDVLTARNGKTVEVLNTDAEGRLILADALCYAVERGATHLVDLATLTGACMIALGTEVAGLMTNSQPWANHVQAAIDQSGERAWQLGMFPDYGELLRSTVADLKNMGGKYGGAIIAAKFLENFVGTTPWVHLDIAGPAFVSEENATRDAGGTGCFVRSLVQLASRFESGVAG
jgi:leucyl aminopeptidase